jgi:hypothetical protein
MVNGEWLMVNGGIGEWGKWGMVNSEWGMGEWGNGE